MSAKFVAILSATVGLLSLSLPAFSHHGTSIVYDLTQSITLTGTVTDFQFVNPHTLIFLEVTGEDGTTVEWLAGLASNTSLGRNDGWTTETLKPGDQISITGAPARGGAPSIWPFQVVLNGEPLLEEKYTG